MTKKCTVLFLAANPTGTGRLQLDEEIRAIDAKIRTADYRDTLELVSSWAIRPDDLLEAFNRHRPHVVHFSGHGRPGGEIILNDSDGRPRPVAKKALTALFTALSGDIQVVVLNACYSEPQAEALANIIDCVVGMKHKVGDTAAIVFAAAFYRAIGYGCSVENAFEQARVAIMLEGTPEENVPVLLSREGVDAARIVLAGPHAPKDGEGPVGNASSRGKALETWKERLAFLQEAEARVADPAQSFALKKQIEEAKAKIRELEMEQR
jgi:hypothetical protein